MSSASAGASNPQSWMSPGCGWIDGAVDGPASGQAVPPSVVMPPVEEEEDSGVRLGLFGWPMGLLRSSQAARATSATEKERSVQGQRMTGLSVPCDERLRQEPPPVDGDEEKELEWEAHLRGVEHLHSEGEEDVRDDEVDDEER